MEFWSGKSVIITGAASGIGKEIARQLGERGARIWMTDLNEGTLQTAAAQIGHDVRMSRLNVSDAAAVKAQVDAVIAEHGHLDALFNNAGIGTFGIADELRTDHFDKTIDVNVKGVTNGFVAAYTHMANRGSGIIVNTASAAGLLALPGLAPYSLSKFAVVGVTQALRLEAAERGVQVSVLCPTAIETPLLDKNNPEGINDVWRPNARQFLTDVGGRPFPVDKFVSHALKKIEQNKGIIVAPLGARLRIWFARLFPGIVEDMTRKAYRKQLALRDIEN